MDSLTIKEAPSLNEARYCHNTCVLGKRHLYVYGGFTKTATLSTIEVLDAAAVIAADPADTITHQWELIKPTGSVPGSRTDAMFAPISRTELVIVGGFSSDYLTDGCFIFNTVTRDFSNQPLARGSIDGRFTV